TIMVDTWFNSAMDTSVYLSQPRGIVQVSEDKFWVSDVMLGGIYEFNSQGKYSHQVISRGKGSNEVIRPFAMSAYHSNGTNEVYIFDGDQQLFLILDEYGNEKKRVITSSVSYKAMIDFPIIINKNSLLWHSFNREDYTLSEWGSTGKFKK